MNKPATADQIEAMELSELNRKASRRAYARRMAEAKRSCIHIQTTQHTERRPEKLPLPLRIAGELLALLLIGVLLMASVVALSQGLWAVGLLGIVGGWLMLHWERDGA